MVLMALAGCFTFALLRRLRLGVAPALVGAALFELNGTFAWMLHGPIMPVAFLPLLLLGLEQSRERFSLACVLGVAWSWLAGFPETAALDMMFACVWGVVRLMQATDRFAYAWRAGAGVVIGLLLAAPAIWPFVQALPGAFVGTHAGVVASGFMPENLALLLFPGVLGAPLAGPLALGQSHAVWVRAAGYCDIVLVVLAVAALRWRSHDAALRFAVLGWIVVTVARALRLPVAVWLFGLVPMLRQANVHLYVLPSWSMGLSILAAFALRDWCEGTLMRKRWIMLAAGALSLIAVVTAQADVAELWARLPHYRALLLIVVAAPLSILALIASGIRRPMIVGAAAIGNAALLFMVPELAGTHGRTVDAGAIGYLQANAGLGRVLSLGPLVPNYGALYGVAEIDHNYLPVPQNWVDYVQAHLKPDSDGVNFYFGAPPAMADLAQLLPAYRAAGVSLVTVAPGTQPFDMQAADAPTLAYRGLTMDIWRLPHPAPYVIAPGCAVAAASRDEVMTDCTAPATLHRLELSQPGWQASVDGAAVPIATDQAIFQTIALPAGKTRVSFRYAPPFMDGAWLAFALGVLALAAVYSPLRSRLRFSSSSA
jgi:hypothetical protein